MAALSPLRRRRRQRRRTALESKAAARVREGRRRRAAAGTPCPPLRFSAFCKATPAPPAGPAVAPDDGRLADGFTPSAAAAGAEYTSPGGAAAAASEAGRRRRRRRLYTWILYKERGGRGGLAS